MKTKLTFAALALTTILSVFAGRASAQITPYTGPPLGGPRAPITDYKPYSDDQLRLMLARQAEELYWYKSSTKSWRERWNAAQLYQGVDNRPALLKERDALLAEGRRINAITEKIKAEQARRLREPASAAPTPTAKPPVTTTAKPPIATTVKPPVATTAKPPATTTAKPPTHSAPAKTSGSAQSSASNLFGGSVDRTPLPTAVSIGNGPSASASSPRSGATPPSILVPKK